jgi:SNF2 family DNA or RNA helicase
MKKLTVNEKFVEFDAEVKTDYNKIIAIAKEKAGQFRLAKEELDQLRHLVAKDDETLRRIRELEAKIKEIRGGMFAILNASRLFCNHPRLLKWSNSGLANEVYESLQAPKKTPKYDLLKQILGEVAPDRSIIIFTFYAKMAKLLQRRLEKISDRKIFVLAGGEIVTVDDILQLKKDYSKSPGAILISTDKGTYGLNLQAASVVINYDAWWNAARIAQRIGRVYRRGQMKDVDIFMLHVRDEDSVEQLIRSVMTRKAIFASRIVDGVEVTSYTETLERR